MNISPDNNPTPERNKKPIPTIIEDFSLAGFLTHPERTGGIEGGLLGISLDPSEHDSFDNRNPSNPNNNNPQNGGPTHEVIPTKPCWMHAAQSHSLFYARAIAQRADTAFIAVAKEYEFGGGMECALLTSGASSNLESLVADSIEKYKTDIVNRCSADDLNISRGDDQQS